MVDTLLIYPAIHRWGRFDPQSQTTRLDPESRPDNEDLINLAVCLVLKHRGNVESITTGNIPGGGVLAAVLRYSPQPAVA